MCIDTSPCIKDHKNEISASPVSVTLTHPIPTDSMMLLTRSSSSPTSPVPETSGRSSPNISFSDKVEIFETLNDSEEDSDDFETICDKNDIYR